MFAVSKVVLLLGIGLAPVSAYSAECRKPFKRALIIAGGQFTPGIALGVIAAAEAADQKPDVIITTCGASIGGAIAHAFDSIAEAKAFAESRVFYDYVRREMRIGNTSLVGLGLNLGGAMLVPEGVPDVYDGTVMQVSNVLPKLLARDRFSSSEGKSRLVVLAARALFDARQAGEDINGRDLFQQTYLTDPETARHLKGFPASMRRNFPGSHIHPATAVLTGVSTVQAARASISDPYLMNPALIGRDFYFAGAVDLFPVETAQALACEVVSTTPSSDYSFFENGAVEQSFGFSQQARTQQLKYYRGVSWIDMRGVQVLAMDPAVEGVTLRDNIPDTHAGFKAKVDQQFRTGYQRALALFKKKPYRSSK